MRQDLIAEEDGEMKYTLLWGERILFCYNVPRLAPLVIQVG
jgi:hypothetical protein